MVVHKKDQRVETRSKMRDGKGDITLVHRAPREVFHHEKMLAELTLPPGASIGLHGHTGETEYYIIRSGQGLVDDNGAKVTVKRGDCVITGNGSTHSIENSGDAPLVLEAIIVGY
ncbi:MAG: cupin domain-containing protein [Spirochaetaceae bacterium]|jgi:mannose-6-phosphate isomerase-like protein (cupin superfamily)|nr:cupin domain-containing protein [Spirochaetaceae bacterium]